MKINIFFIILALPLLAIPPLFFPPEWAKAIVFRMIFSVILALFLWQASKNSDFLKQSKQKYILQKKLIWLLLAVLAVGFLSLIFSSDILFSLWASPHRSGGFMFFSFCVLFSIALFLTAEEKNWKNFWNFSFVVGDIVALFGLVQYFNLFPKIFASFGRPVSTLSNTILLAVYLLFLTFSILPFVIAEKSKKRYFYIFSLLLFVFGIIITGSRAAWLGFLAGVFYFFFFYPVKNLQMKKTNWLLIFKIAAVSALILAASGIYYLNSDLYVPDFLKKNGSFQAIRSRASIGLFLADPRFSAWQVAWQAIKEKPVLGWGPENQSIGFDKHYDPSLPYLTREWGSWWDRAHNIFLDLALQYGVIFLAVYIFFFGYLFWRLRKTKSIFTHAIQTVLVAYFVALFFGFDSVSTYIILFFIIGYSLHITCQNNPSENHQAVAAISKSWQFFNKKRKIIAGILLILLAWFLWQYNLKPLIINAQINKAEKMTCAKKLPALEKLFNQKSFLDAYLRLFYVEETKKCAEENSLATIDYIKNGVDALKYVSKVRPFYTRTWILLGSFKTILFANETNPEAKQNLFKEANSDFEKALSLAPKHQETLAEWAKLYFAAGDYAKMKKMSEECISLNSDTSTCYWYLGLAEIMLSDKKSGEEHLQIAREKRFPYGTQTAYNQLALVYTQTKDYQELIPIYETLISLDSKNIQYYATLAVVYKELGDYKKAKETALKIIKIAPEARDEVNAFLQTLSY